MKRFLDLILAGVGLVFVSPLLLVAIAIIRCTSKGPVFFQQKRVGKNFKTFYILKLRTMVVDASENGLTITRSGDHRITPVGRFLRKTKIDELPQLINVLLGHMSLVGPRPEVPEYVELFREDFDTILSVRPGITDPSSIEFRNESELLQEAPDPQVAYIEIILPKKLAISKLYIEHASLPYDLLLIFKTFIAIFYSPKRKCAA